MSAQIIGPVSRTVGMTPAVAAQVDVRAVGMCVIYVYNESATQTYSGSIGSRLTSGSALPFAPSTLGDLASIPPGEARSVQINCEALSEVELQLSADGAGGEAAQIVIYGGALL